MSSTLCLRRLAPAALLTAGSAWALIAACVAAGPASVEARSTPRDDRSAGVRVATYNIEHFMQMFDQVLMPERSRERQELYDDEEDRYEVARTLEGLDADIVGIQECCSQEMLEWFNREDLGGRYAYVKVFPSNVAGQWVGMLAKKGFRAIQERSFAGEVDPVRDGRLERIKGDAGLWEKNLLFSRGPGFVLFEAPSGERFWVGATHVKSKYGNSEAVTAWRIREVKRTREICHELLAEGKTDKLVMLGDFNDDLGMDYHERKLRADAVAVMTADDSKLTSLTFPLAQADANRSTYHCEIKPPRYRSFIDHIFVSPAMAGWAGKVAIFDDPIAAAASDHYPVWAELTIGPSGR
jgi:endonuclease/exonuclease/phosphatase family metal-dependent hydrolase